MPVSGSAVELTAVTSPECGVKRDCDPPHTGAGEQTEPSVGLA